MPIETTSPRTGAMVFWIALLALAALALGAGTFVFARRSVERASTAELFFNPDAAYVDDFSLTHADRPAVAAAQSILNDTVVLDVLGQAGDSSADTAAAVAEFRSGMELAEPRLEMLQLRYRDPDPRRACAVANAVATALEEWAPAVPAPAASNPRAKTPPAARAVRPDPLASAYSTLADLEGRVAGLDERLGGLAGQPTPADQPLYPAPLTAAQADKRRSLVAQLAETLRKLDDLRARSAGNDSDTGTTERRIAEFQHELAAFPLPASASSQGSATVGAASLMAQLRVQRRDLVNEIAAEMRSIVRLREHPAAVTTAEQPNPAPAPPVQAAVSERQNPFRIARRAGMAPRLLAQPAWLAIGISTLFFAAGAFGIYLYWHRETQTADTADGVWGERPFILIPPMSVAARAAAHQPMAVVPQAGQGLAATEPEAEPEPIASEPEAEWEAGGKEPEGDWGAVAGESEAESEAVAREPEAEQEPVVSEPEVEPELIASEPEAEWETVAREPEAVWEPIAREPDAVWEPVAMEPVATEPVQLAGEEPDAPLISSLLISAPQILQEAEVATPLEPAQPTGTEEPPETAPEAADELVHLDPDTPKMPEDGRPTAQPETSPETAPQPVPAWAQADEPSTGNADEMDGGRRSFVDPGLGDAEWSARILQALDRTSIAHWPEAGPGGATSKRTASTSPDKLSDAAENRAPERPGSRDPGRE